MVQSAPGNIVLTIRLIAHIFLLYSCFSGIRTNRRFSINLGNLDHLEYSKTLYDLGEF
jgi:hypothetical protein